MGRKKGSKLSEETKQKISRTRNERQIRHTDEAKKRIGEASRSKERNTPELIARRVAARARAGFESIKGLNNPNGKLSFDEVTKIRYLFEHGRSIEQLAYDFKISNTYIRYIVEYKRRVDS